MTLRTALDLNDASGQPSHSKVLSTVAFGLVLPAGLALCFLGLHEPAALTAGTVLVSLACALPFGLAGFKAWAKSSGGGTTTALQSAVTAAIAQRRAAAGDDHEPTLDP